MESTVNFCVPGSNMGFSFLTYSLGAKMCASKYWVLCYANGLGSDSRQTVALIQGHSCAHLSNAQKPQLTFAGGKEHLLLWDCIDGSK